MSFLGNGNGSKDDLIAFEEERFEEVNKGFDQLLQELNLSREQLRTFLMDRSQFTEADWNQMTSMRADLEKRLDERLSKTPKTSSVRTRSSLASIQPNWIFVR